MLSEVISAVDTKPLNGKLIVNEIYIVAVSASTQLGIFLCIISTTNSEMYGSKRARKAPRLDQGVRLEKSRQSARECRVRKKLRYQYLEELVQERERAIYALRRDLEKFRGCCRTLDRGELPSELIEKIGRQKLIEIIQTEDPSDENANMSQHMQQQRTMNLHNNGHASSACIAPPPQLSHPRLQMPQQPMTPMHLVQQIPNGSQVTLTAATAAQQAPMSVYNHMNPPMLPGAGPSML